MWLFRLNDGVPEAYYHLPLVPGTSSRITLNARYVSGTFEQRRRGDKNSTSYIPKIGLNKVLFFVHRLVFDILMRNLIPNRCRMLPLYFLRLRLV